MIVTDFKMLFSIEFIHDFFIKDEDMLRDVSIMPDKETAITFKNYNMQWRINKNKLYCFVQTKTNSVLIDNKPLVDFKESDVLKFKLNIINGQFMNYTNLPLFETQNKIYRFANDSVNHHGIRYFLSRPVPAYSTANAYQMGMLACVGIDSREAIQYSDATSPRGFSHADFWTEETDFVGFVNQSDLVEKVYKENEKEEKCFAEIEISLSKNLLDDFSLLKPDNTIRGMKYLIHFESRNTFWTYQLKHAGTVKDTSNQITFDITDGGKKFTSKKPVALSEKGIKTILLNNDSNKVLPGANAILLKPKANPFTKKSQIISEINISN